MSPGPVMLDLVGTFISPQEREMLLHPQTGGVILFTRNYESVEQITALVADIHKLRSPHLLVAVDHEGGRVQRFRDGFTHIPAAAVYAKHFVEDKKQALLLARECGWLMAAECRGVGIDISFAPVLDIDKGVSGVIGDRAYHSNPQTIVEFAQAYMQGMHLAGMVATGKHFPGHGSVKEDSHTAQPIDGRSLDDILREDIVPFERMIQYGLAGVMPAHVVYPAVDELPAGYSPVWLQQILRQKLNFQGMIFSDDLSMQAAGVAGNFAARAQLALAAGCDMVLVCNHSQGAQQVLESLENHTSPASQTRLLRMHGAGDSLDRKTLMATDEWKSVVDKINQLDDAANPELDV